MVRLSGRVPKDVRGWSLSYQFAMGWYALEVRADDQPVRTLWLEGGKPGEAVALDPQTMRRRVCHASFLASFLACFRSSSSAWC